MIDYLTMSYNYELVEFEPLRMSDILDECNEVDKDIPVVFKIIGRIDNHIQKHV